MSGLSIVIPCRLFDQCCEETLVSVLQNRPPRCEVIVVTAGRYHDPYQLTGEVRFAEEAHGASLGQLANRGFREARFDVVHLLQPGTCVVEGWTGPALVHFDDRRVSSVSPAVVRQASDDRALWLGVGYWACGVRRLAGRGARLSGQRTSPTQVLGPTFAAGFYRRDVVNALGGFDDHMGAQCADVELALAMRELSTCSVVERACRIVASSTLAIPEFGFQSARHLERIYRRYPPARTLPRLLHGVVAAWEVLARFPHPRMLAPLVGRLLARCELGVRKRQLRRMQEAACQLSRTQEPAHTTSIRVNFADHRARPTGTLAADQRRAA